MRWFAGLARIPDNCENSRERFHLARVECSLVNPQIVDGGAAQRFTRAALANLEGNLRADRSTEVVVFNEDRLFLAVVENFQTRSLAGAVVADGNVNPCVGLQRSLAEDLQSCIRPGADDVHSDPPLLNPHVPAAILGPLFHPRTDRAIAVVRMNLDPGGTTEGLIRLEIADVGQLARRSLDLDRLGRRRRTRLPRCRLDQFDLTIAAIDLDDS